MYRLGKCVVVVEDGEDLCQVRVERLTDTDGQAKVDGQWVPVSYLGQVNGKLAWQQEEEE
jgi:hypothetical protein